MNTQKKTFVINRDYNWGDKWFGVPCSANYMQKMIALFDNYQTTNNRDEFYKSYLIEFKNEFEKISNSNVLYGLLKLVTPDDDSNLAQVVYKKINQRKIQLPNSIIELYYDVKYKSKLELTMNNGWSISFRIHNASTKVETSLKFDIQLQSKPEDIFYLNRKW